MARCKGKHQLWMAFLLFAGTCLSLIGSLIWSTSSASAAIAQQVMIVKYHAGTYGVWITLANVTDQDIDLSNWQMNDYKTSTKANAKWKLPDGTMIRGRSLLVIEQRSGEGSAGAAEHGIPVVASPGNTVFGLSPGGEKLLLWDQNGQVADELAFQFAYPDSPFYISDNLQDGVSAFERVSTMDTDTSGDWRKVTSADSAILAWEWTPLSGGLVSTNAPAADLITFDHSSLASARLIGREGAVEAAAIVKIYDSATRGEVLATAESTANGSFQATFDNASSLSAVYATATAQGKKESAVTELTAVYNETTPAPLSDHIRSAYRALPSFIIMGQGGAVADNVAVRLYDSASKDHLLGAWNVGVAASPFVLTFESTSVPQTLYMTAKAAGKNESTAVPLTVENDVIPPTIVSSAPVDGASDVETNAPVKATFAEALVAGDALSRVSIKDADNNPLSDVQAILNGTELSIAHAPFARHTTYNVTIPAQAVQDLLGNLNPSDITWSFTTAAAPTTTAAISLQLPGGNIVKPGQAFEAQVAVDDYASLYGVQFQLNYDPARLRIVGADQNQPKITAGELWQNHANAAFVTQVEQDQGRITFAGTLVGEIQGMSGTDPISVAKLMFEAIGTQGATSIGWQPDSVKLAAYPSAAEDLIIMPVVSDPMNVTIEPVASGDKAVISLETAVQEVKTGVPFTVRVNADDYVNLYGAQVQVAYDPTRLQLQDDNASDPGVQVKAGMLFGKREWLEVMNQADASVGKATFAAMLRAGTEGVSGTEPASVAELTFIPIGPVLGGTSIALVADAAKLAGYPSANPSDWQLPFDVAGSPLTVTVNPGTSDLTAPAWPQNAALEAEHVEQTSLVLKWPEAVDDVGVIGYQLYRNGEAMTADAISVTEHVYSAVMNGLTAGTAYTFGVEAVDASGKRSGKLSRTVQTQPVSGGEDKQAPAWPEGSRLEAAGVGYYNVALKWSEAADNVGVAAYRIYRGSALLATVSGTVYSYNAEGLMSGTAYTFAVEAGDAAGNWSAERLKLETATKRSGSEHSDRDHGSGGNSVGNSGGTKTPVPATSVEGITLPNDAVKTSKEGTTMIVVVDDASLAQALDKLKNVGASAQRIIIHVAQTDSAAVQLQLPANVLAAAAGTAPNAVIVLHAGELGYELPLGLVNLEQVAKEMNASLKDMKLHLTMRPLTGTQMDQLNAGLQGMSLLTAAEFSLAVESGASSRTVDSFGSTLVKRTFTIPAEADLSQLTGVRIENNQPIFVPAVFQTADGVVTAIVMSPTNSAYGILRHKKTFPDLTGHWSQQDVELLASKLIVQGTADNSFTPDNPITRAEFAALLVRALGIPASGKAVSYRDVTHDDWFSGAVGAASAAGLVDGFEDGSFKPQALITREQMAVMLARALKAAGKPQTGAAAGLASYSDKHKVSAWAQDALRHALETGIIGGMTDTTLEPAQHASRAQAAVMLKRLLQYAGYMNP